MPSWSNGLDGATVVVESGLASAPSVAIGSTTFTDLTAYVREVTIGIGRGTELDDYSPSRCEVLLDNRDRRFDPLHSAGPYFGTLLPGRRLRVKVTVSAVTVALFTGYVRGWPQAYDLGGDSVVALQAVDGLSKLARAQLASVYEQEVRADVPSLWWRLGESAGTVAVDSSGNGVDGTYLEGATFNSIAGFVVDNDTAINFTPAMGLERIWVLPTPPLSVEFWFKWTPGALADPSVFVFGPNTDNRVQIRFDAVPASGSMWAEYWQGGGVTTNLYSATTSGYGNGLVHHAVVVWPSTTAAPVIYIDGTAATIFSSAAVGTATSLGTQNLQLNRTFFSTVIDTNLALDEFAIYPSALSSARAAAHYSAGTAPWVGLDTGAVISKVLDAAAWPSADRSIETGKSTVIAVRTVGRSALDIIKTLEATEQGHAFIAGDGKFTFDSRHHAITASASTTVQTTFGDGGGSERPYDDLQIDYSDTFLRNKVTVQRFGGATFVLEDATSQAAYDEYADSLSGLLNSSDSEVRDLGLWRLYHYKDPAVRFTTLTITPRSDPTNLFPIVRDRKILDRVNVKRRPQGIGSAISQDSLIEGITHRISSDLTWSTTYGLSPAETQGYLVLDDAVFGVLDSNSIAF